ncbi:MAG: hypothetical protein LBL75_02620 [Rickettsiales bacterium]|jgi:hypothetical protein|nr:hypothetical protein [Rickettsiales bacterium]
MKKINVFYLIFVLCSPVMAAPTAKTQSVISNSASVAQRVAATGLYDQVCYDTYYGCMDSFCSDTGITLNLPNGAVIMNGGSCACSAENAKLYDKISAMNVRLGEANTLKTIEVERINAGATADIIFTGSRQYDKDGNVILDVKPEQKLDVASVWGREPEDPYATEEVDITTLTGAELYNGANEMCLSQMPANCDKDIKMLTSLYSARIKSDCAGFSNTIAQNQALVEQEFASAEKAVRDANKASLDSANEYDLGECILAFRKCMNGPDVCGEDWGQCVMFTASDNIQNNVKIDMSQFTITSTTKELLDSKRSICGRELDKCVAVRDRVWTDFLREVAPSLHLAELNAESKQRSSCLSDISSCLQKACQDDIAGRGMATMDACLARPEMARSFCKVQIEPCERIDKNIWTYVTSQLASRRIDRCTEEVKTCFTDRCGTDFSECIGLDYNYMHDICPLDKLVVCKQDRPDFSMKDLDSMLMGLYAQIDNAALSNCQNLVKTKMQEICGSTNDCNKFAADDIMGAGSLSYQKKGSDYVIQGLMSLGNVSVGSALDPKSAGVVDVTDYMKNVKRIGANSGYTDAAKRVENELTSIQGTINRVIELISADQQVRYCVEGRDLSQITGQAGTKTQARFPNLLNEYKQMISESALAKARDNYVKKYAEVVAQAAKEADTDTANLICNRMPQSTVSQTSRNYWYGTTISTSGGAGSFTANNSNVGAYELAEVFSGVDKTNLVNDSKHITEKTDLANGGYHTTERWSIFTRETRNCHFCTKSTTVSCSRDAKFWTADDITCSEPKTTEKCEDIPM